MNRIACVVDTISRKGGGLNASLIGLMSAMQRRGDQVRIFSVRDQHTEEDKAQWAEFEIVIVNSVGPRMFGFAPALSRQLQSWAPDIVHSHGLWTYSSLAVRNWGRRAGKPVVIHPHGMLDKWALQNSAWKKQLALLLAERRNLEDAACIRALSLAELESVRQLGLKTPVCIVPNGVDLAPAKDADRSIQHAGRRLLLYLGRLHPKKGIELLVNAWGASQRAPWFSKWTLVIAGWDQGGHENELKAAAAQHGLPWRDLKTKGDLVAELATYAEGLPPVVFTGPVFGSAKETLYQQCDAFALPSYSEGLPMVVLEAWSHQKPVIMTPLCNIPEGFAAGAAIEVQPDTASVASGLEVLCAMSDEERHAMGGRGLRLVKEEFAWDQVAGKMHEVDSWLTGRGPKPDIVHTCPEHAS